jgi:hypothetical protein
MSDGELDLLIDRKRGTGGTGSVGGGSSAGGKSRAKKAKGRIVSGQQHSAVEFVNTGMAAVPVAARDFQVSSPSKLEYPSMRFLTYSLQPDFLSFFLRSNTRGDTTTNIALTPARASQTAKAT